MHDIWLRYSILIQNFLSDEVRLAKLLLMGNTEYTCTFEFSKYYKVKAGMLALGILW